MQLLGDPDVLGAVSSPLRRQLLDRLHEPASASELSKEMNLSRQALNYHLRELERLGLVELVEERRRRGFVERILRAKPGRLVVDPAVLEPIAAAMDLPTPSELDRHAAEHLAAVAGRLVRDVVTMQEEAQQAGRRLLMFTVETDVRIASPAAVDRFATALADAVARVVSEHDTPGGRHYRVVAGGHPRRQLRQGAS